MKSLISMRLGPTHHLDDKLMDRLIGAMNRHKGCADDVWLTTPFSFPSMESHRKNVKQMKRAADKLRENGYKVTLQLACTIGHGWLGKLGDTSSFQSVMKCYDGTDETLRSCPGDKKFLEYIYNMVSEYMVIAPEIIFIDDDLRLNIHAYGCFCDRCVGEFNQLNNASFTPKTLYKEIRSNQNWKELWVDFGDRRLSEVAGKVIDAGQAHKKDIQIGLQTVSSFAYNPYRHICDIVYQKTGKAPLIRAGGLAYKDQEPREMIQKALDIAYQRALLPTYIDDFRPELESFPHTIMNKTAKGFVLEAAMNLALSCNTVSIAAIVMDNEPMFLYENIFEKLARARPYFKQLSQLQDTTYPGGVQILTAPLALPKTPGVLTETTPADVVSRIEFGLPMSYLIKNETSPCYLSLEMAKTIPLAALTKLEKRHLIIEAKSILVLQERGFGSCFPVTIKQQERSEREYFTDDERNHGFEGETWYWPSTAEVYSVYCDTKHVCCSRYAEDDTPSTIVYTNTEGKKVAVIGSINGDWPLNSRKRLQILRIADYLSDTGLPAYVETPSQTLCIPRVTQDNQVKAVTIVNESIEAAENLVICIKNACGKSVKLVGMNTQEKEIPFLDNKLVIPEMAPWDIVTAFFDK